MYKAIGGCAHSQKNKRGDKFFVTSEACSVLISPEGTKCGKLDFQLNTQEVKESISLGAQIPLTAHNKNMFVSLQLI